MKKIYLLGWMPLPTSRNRSFCDRVRVRSDCRRGCCASRVTFFFLA